MTYADWYSQGELLGSMTTIQDWTNEMQAATNDPGTVQIHIQRTLDKAAAEKAEINRKANCQPCTIDPIVYNFEYHAALTKALALLNVG